MKSKNRKTGRPLAWLVGVIVACVIGWKYLNEWYFRKLLPRSASNVKEWYRTHGVLPDYAYLLKAKIPQNDFMSYIPKFEMTIHTSDRVYKDAPRTPHWPDHFESGKEWWDPMDDLNTTYVYQKGDEWIMAKHENGWLYLKALNH
jgi:hypothetical protein